MQRIALIACTVAMLGCQSQPDVVSNAIRFAFPSMVFEGQYTTQLTLDDVRQIVAIGKSRSDILKPIHKIWIEQPNEAKVQGGDPQRTGDPVTSFKVRKQNGHWRLIEKSLYTTKETIVTS